MNNDMPWVRLPADWRTQALSVGMWTADEVVDLIESWQEPAPRDAQFDAAAFEAFVQEQADVVMAMVDEVRTYRTIGEFMSKSGADHQRDAVVVALRRAYPQPHGLDRLDVFLAEMGEEVAAAEKEPQPDCEFCEQRRLVVRLRGELRTMIGYAMQYRRERFGLFFRAQT